MPVIIIRLLREVVVAVGMMIMEAEAVVIRGIGDEIMLYDSLYAASS